MKHLCHARNCKVEVDPSMFMCRRHWWMVPGYLRAAIWDNYRPGQEIDKSPSKEYLNVALQAINHVAALENSGVT